MTQRSKEICQIYYLLSLVSCFNNVNFFNQKPAKSLAHGEFTTDDQSYEYDHGQNEKVIGETSGTVNDVISKYG